MEAVSLTPAAIRIELLKTRQMEQLVRGAYVSSLESFKDKERKAQTTASQASWLEKTIAELKWEKVGHLEGMQSLANYENYLRALAEGLSKVNKLIEKDLSAARRSYQEDALALAVQRKKREDLRKLKTRIKARENLAGELRESTAVEEIFPFRSLFGAS